MLKYCLHDIVRLSSKVIHVDREININTIDDNETMHQYIAVLHSRDIFSEDTENWFSFPYHITLTRV